MTSICVYLGAKLGNSSHDVVKQMHPFIQGEILRDELGCLGLSANPFSMKLHTSANRITAILNGKRSIYSETALKRGKKFRIRLHPYINNHYTAIGALIVGCAS